MNPEQIVMRACALAATALFTILLVGCGITKPCEPEKLNCDSGTRSTGAVSRPTSPPASAPSKGPSESNNPGKPASGGQVGKPNKPHGGKHGGHKK